MPLFLLVCVVFTRAASIWAVETASDHDADFYASRLDEHFDSLKASKRLEFDEMIKEMRRKFEERLISDRELAAVDDPTGSSNEVVGTLRQIPSTSRTLLHQNASIGQDPASRPPPPCTGNDLFSVANAANQTAAIATLAKTKAACANCVQANPPRGGNLPWGSVCLPEPTCAADNATLLQGLVHSASLEDRQGLIKIFDVVSASCSYCLLETIGFVCGETCANDVLHLWQDVPPAARNCMPGLAWQLQKDMAQRLSAAASRGEPFGMVSSDAMRDLFVPSDEKSRALGRPVYVGVDSGRTAFLCEPTTERGAFQIGTVWAFSAVAGEEAPRDCASADLWLDMETGAQYSTKPLRPAAHNSLLTFAGWPTCKQYAQQSLQKSNSIVLSTSSDYACALARFFGPQTAVEASANTPLELTFPGDLSSIALVSDLIVRAGVRLRLSGSGANNTVVVGSRQIYIYRGGQLAMDGVIVAESTMTSAVRVEGDFSARGVTFRDCTTTTNGIMVSLEGIVPGKRRAWLQAFGAAILIFGTGRLELVDSTIVSCKTEGGLVVNWAGAIYVCWNGQANIKRTRLLQNAAVGGTFLTQGGKCLLAS